MAGSGNFKFSIKISPNPHRLAAMYDEVRDAMRDYRAAWRKLAPALGAGLSQNITTKGSAIGESWPRPNRGYSKRKTLDGFGSVQLVRGGDLKRKIGSGSIVDMGKSFLSVGLSSGKLQERAVGLNFDKKGARGHKFMGWSPHMKASATRILGEHIEIATRAAAARLRSGA